MRKNLRKLVFLKNLGFRLKYFFPVIFLIIAVFSALWFLKQADSGSLEFYTVTDYPVGKNAWHMVSRDLNNDGHLDIISANKSVGGISIFFGNADGTFGSKTDYSTGSGNQVVEAIDINGDQYADILTANETSNDVSVLLNNTDGTFASSVQYPAGNTPSSVRAGDFDEDGFLDLVVTNFNGDNFSVLLGNGDGTFNPPYNISTGDGPWLGEGSVYDFNNDGHVDVAVINEFDSNFSLFLGRGDGTFEPRVNFASAWRAWIIAFADLNNDNNPDAITTNVVSNSFSVLFGDGLGNFSGLTTYPTGNNPWYPLAIDVNGDNYLDVLTPNLDDNNFSVFINKGDGSFYSAYYIDTIDKPSVIVGGDFNSDSIADFAVVNQDDINTKVRVYLNKIIKSACSLTPSSLTQGGAVTINASFTLPYNPANRVWATVENGGNLLIEFDLDYVNGIDYKKQITATADYLGQNDVAVFATDSVSGETYACNLSNGVAWEKTTPNDMPWDRRSSHKAVSYNGRIYLMGGIFDGMLNDVWSTADGLNWRLETAAAPWGERGSFGLIVFNNRMWVIGGNKYIKGGDFSTYTYYKDIWSSIDGKNWTLENSNAPWGERTAFGLTVYDGKIWLSGGSERLDPTTFVRKNDVWSSVNGKDWVREVETAAWDPVTFHQMITFDNGSGEKMWLIGGNKSGYVFSQEVWSSSDGIDWDLETATPLWGEPNSGDPLELGRYTHQVIIYDNGSGKKMWLMGGGYQKNANTRRVTYNDVYSSINGVDWNLEVNPGFKSYPVGTGPSDWTHWAARFAFPALVHDDGGGSKMWILGGYEGRVRAWNDVWYTSDGSNWYLKGNNYEGIFGTRFDHQMVAFNNKLWIIGGISTGHAAQSDVWSSIDGENWICEAGSHLNCPVGSTPGWSARWGHHVLAYNDGTGEKMWLIGGCAGNFSDFCQNGLRTKDVWSSADGINWTQETAIANYTWSHWPTAIVYNDGTGEKMWLMGGWVPGIGYDNQVWYSSNGINWTKTVPDAPWNGRTAQESVVYDDGISEKVYLTGGYFYSVGTGQVRYNDVWSFDGATWVQETAAAPWAGRYAFGLLNYDNKMWLFGGQKDPEYFPALWTDEVWYSTNGADWLAATLDAPFEGRDFFEAEVFDNRMWLSGGDTNHGSANDVWASRYDFTNLTFSVIPPSYSGTLPSTYAQAETPDNFICEAISGNTISWQFTDSTENVIGYRLYERIDYNTYILIKDIAQSDINQIQESDLNANSQYSRFLASYNANSESSPTEIVSCYTLANIPEQIIIIETTNENILIKLDPNDGNPAETQYAIKELISGLYLQADGTLAETEVWQTYSGWGGESGIRVIVEPGQNYDFSAKARNGDGMETDFGPATSSAVPEQGEIILSATKGVAVNLAQNYRGLNFTSMVQAAGGLFTPMAENKYQSLLREFSFLLNIIILILLGYLGFSLFSSIKHIGKGLKWQKKISLLGQLIKKEPAEIFEQHAQKNTSGIYNISYSYHKNLQEQVKKNLQRTLGLVAIKLIVMIVLVSGLLGVYHFSTAQNSGYADNGQAVSAGDILTYVIEISNQGTEEAVGILVTDNIDSNLENFTVSSLTDCGTYTDNSTTTQLNITGIDVAVGTDCIIKFTANVKIGTEGNSIINQAQVSGPDFSAILTNTTSNTVKVAEIPEEDLNENINEAPEEEINENINEAPLEEPDEEPVITPEEPTPLQPQQPEEPGPISSGQILGLFGSTIQETIADIGAVISQTIETLRTAVFDNPQVEKASQNIATPLILTIALVNAVPAILAVSVYLLPYLHLLFLEPFLLFFRKKRKKWGIVYNSLSKIPVDLALVRLYSQKDKKLIQTKVTDRQGRYLLIVAEPGKYYLEINKPGFTSPTKFLKDEKQDSKYIDLYHGEEIEVTEKGAVITANIPLDPIAQKMIPIGEIIRAYIIKNLRHVISFLGIILSVLIVLIIPTAITIGALIFHVLLYLLFRRALIPTKPKSWGIVYDEKSKEPLRYAIVRIFDLKFNKLLETQVTDSKGRYSFLVGKNEYQLLMEKQGYQKKEIKPVDLIKNEEIVSMDVGMQKARNLA